MYSNSIPIDNFPTVPINSLANTPLDRLPGFTIGKITSLGQVVSMVPVLYRLMKKKDSSLVLQGAYRSYTYETNAENYDWKDIPTEIET